MLVKTKCKVCKSNFEFYKKPSSPKGRGQTCSMKCSGIYKRGKIVSPKTQFGGSRASFKQGKKEKNSNWKAEKIGKHHVHRRLEWKYGKPQKCEDCSTTTAKRFDWANITGIYEESRKNWKRLCRSCHVKLDRNWEKK